MSDELERALSRLRSDDQVLGYSLMTRVGRPFVSFSFPDELFPRVKDSINLYKSDLRLMTTDTENGLVVLSPVDDNWILSVLYVPELQLGLAIAKTKNVLRLLEGSELPPPPEDFEDSAESNLKVLESLALQAASTSPAESQAETDTTTEPTVDAEPEPTPFSTLPDRPLNSFNIQLATIPTRGTTYSTAMAMDSDLHKEMKELHKNFGFDVLMLVDGCNSVAQISDSMFQSNERVIELLMWAASKWIVDIPEAKEEEAVPEVVMGKLVKCPRFEGDLSKMKGDDLEVLRLCNGTRTTQEIAESTGMPHPKVVEIIVRNKKHGMKMIGRTT